MNSLRQILDEIQSNEGCAVNWRLRQQDIEVMLASVERHATNAVCFYAGEAEELVGLRFVKELCKLPYPTTYIEATFDGSAANFPMDRFAVLYATNAAGEVEGYYFRHECGEWTLLGSTISSVANLSAKCVAMCGGDANYLDAMQGMRDVSCCFLSALHCINVGRVKNDPPAALSRSRAKKGKQPLFSYWTLELDIGNRDERGQSLGGTHASPRVHLRRGHFRQFDPGRWTWVQPHVVGDRKLGMVHKDYAVAGAVQ